MLSTAMLYSFVIKCEHTFHYCKGIISIELLILSFYNMLPMLYNMLYVMLTFHFCKSECSTLTVLQ